MKSGRFIITGLLFAASVASAQGIAERATPYLASARAAGDAFVVVSSASAMPNVAADSLATAVGSNLAPRTETGSAPYPTSLGGITLHVVDSRGADRLAALLYVSPSQINFLIPAGTAAGTAAVNIIDAAGNAAGSHMQIQPVAPALFTANGDGQGVVAATAYRTIAGSNLAFGIPVYECLTGPGSCKSIPIDLGLDTPVIVTFYATGLRGRSSDTAVTLTIGGQTVPIRSIFASADGTSLAGVDEVVAGLVLSLRGLGEADVVLGVDGKTSNAGRINIGSN